MTEQTQGLPTYPQQAPVAAGPPPGAYAAAATTSPFAPWISRVGGFIVDSLILMPGYVLAAVGGVFTDTSTGVARPSPVGLAFTFIGFVVMLATGIWNQYIRQGRTGWTVGKQVVGIRLVSEQTGQPIGAGMAFVRSLAHMLDSLTLYVGWLWPLWDRKRQTFADKIMKTVVVQQRKG